MTLRVKLEIVPHGDEERAYEIGRLDIFNKGESEFGIYKYGVIELRKDFGGLHDRYVYHRRNLGAWELLRKILFELPVEGPK